MGQGELWGFRRLGKVGYPGWRYSTFQGEQLGSGDVLCALGFTEGARGEELPIRLIQVASSEGDPRASGW